MSQGSVIISKFVPFWSKPPRRASGIGLLNCEAFHRGTLLPHGLRRNWRCQPGACRCQRSETLHPKMQAQKNAGRRSLLKHRVPVGSGMTQCRELCRGSTAALHQTTSERKMRRQKCAAQHADDHSQKGALLPKERRRVGKSRHLMWSTPDEDRTSHRWPAYRDAATKRDCSVVRSRRRGAPSLLTQKRGERTCRTGKRRSV